MGDHSAIEWTDATWNPVTGCTKISPGCKFCYAERLTERWGRGDFRKITLHSDRLELPIRWRAPRRIFVNSMSDLFHEKVPFDYVDQVFEVMAQARQHVFQVLTKRPDRLVLWHERHGRLAIPSHVWLGVSVESSEYLWRTHRLRQVNVPIRFISAEPLLGALKGLELTGISWVISGGESGGTPQRSLVERTGGAWRPKPDAISWVREIRDACAKQSVAFFHKQWGGPTPKAGGRYLDRRLHSAYPALASTAPT